MVKEELASKNSGILELRLETLAFINFNSSFEKDYLLLYSESAGTIRKIYKNIKKTYKEVNLSTVIRSSDAHYPEQIGEIYTVFNMKKISFPEIRKALNRQENRYCEWP